MARYLISFPSDAMDQIPEEEMPDVAEAAHAVCQEAINAGVYVLAGGLEDQPASIVATDGTVTDGPKPDVISGITIVDVPSPQEALKWAAKVAAACRCTQEVREIGFDPELDAMLSEAASRSVQDRELTVPAQLSRTNPGESASVRHRTPRRKAVQSALP